MASESKSFGLGSLVSGRFHSEFTPTPTPSPSHSSENENYTAIGEVSCPLITEDVELKGELAFSGELKFNGRFEGTLDSSGAIITHLG